MAFTFNAAAGDQEKYSAESVIAEQDNASSLDATRAAEADAANVQTANQIGYAQVLGLYEARTDTEPLADRRARESGETFSDADFARAEGYTGEATAPQTSRT